jgi:hypothetical protein
VAPATNLAQQQTILPINIRTSRNKWLVAAIALIAQDTTTFCRQQR